MPDFVFRAESPAIFPADIRSGDTILLCPGEKHPAMLIRPLPANYGAYLGLLEDGIISPVNSSFSDAEEQLSLLSAPSPPPGPPSRPARVLTFPSEGAA